MITIEIIVLSNCPVDKANTFLDSWLITCLLDVVRSILVTEFATKDQASFLKNYLRKKLKVSAEDTFNYKYPCIGKLNTELDKRSATGKSPSLYPNVLNAVC